MSNTTPLNPQPKLQIQSQRATGAWVNGVWQRFFPPMLIGVVIILMWFGGSVVLNRQLAEDYLHNQGATEVTTEQWVGKALNLERPKLPTPIQIYRELVRSLWDEPVASKRSLVYHSFVTLEATLVGAALGVGFGIGLAVLLIYIRSLGASLMPWIIASQTVPIIALAPMCVVILNQMHVTGVWPKAVIAAYLSFFPVTLGMFKGLRAAEKLHLDLMKTYSANGLTVFLRLRLPASLPFLFASLKIGVSASLVGTVVAELTKSEDGGLGARLLAGSYYGQTVQIWAALVMASLGALLLVGLVSISERAMRIRG
ncbi:MAG: ABC transporter permease [Alphaproteobacteria bacterium]|nr:ABC transporter permease [Alphaproteobacteria bacterium]